MLCQSAITLFASLLLLAHAKPILSECEPGYYHITPTKCAQCPAGTFQMKAGKGGCIPCPTGTISADGGATSCTECSLTTMPDASRTKCVCPKGSVQKGDGSCSMCKPGSFFVKFGDFASCEPCQRDTFQALPGESECVDCAPGSFSGDGATQCTKCLPNEVLLGGKKCGQCAKGYTYLAGPRECIACASGFFKASVGQGPCIRCAPNGFSGKGAASCKMCPKGTALMANGKCGECPAGSSYDAETKSCSACAPGTFTREANAMKHCIACAGDSFSFAGATECITCPVHTALMKDGTCAACAEGELYNTVDLTCEQCPINSVSDGGKMSFCFPCSEGSFAKPGSSVCYECGFGKVLLASSLKCGTCPAGTFYNQVSGTCS